MNPLDLNFKFKSYVDDNRLLVWKSCWIPAFVVESDVSYIYLDIRIINQVIKIIHEFDKFGINFILISPTFSNPKYQKSEDFDDENIRHLLRCFLNEDIFLKMESSGIDYSKMIANYLSLRDCYSLIYEYHQDLARSLSVKWYRFNFSSNKVRDEIVFRFKTLIRDISISRLDI